jgi:FtsH-binding integral membrane protein
MPHSGLLALSGVCLLAAVAFILFPNPLERLSNALNKTLVTIDKRVMRHRHLIGVLMFVTSYLVFYLAMRAPEITSY